MKLSHLTRLVPVGLLLLLAAQMATAAITYPAAEWVTGTLPVLYITTEDSVPITSKTEYVNAIYWLDPMGAAGVSAVGSADAPLAMEIKGRGNASWNRVKKPYRLRLAEKVPLMGMNKNRHFVLLNEWSDGRGRLTWEMGFYVSRLLGLQWTPEHHPVELVLNGDYQGLYFLTEKIRVGKQRVNITEQDNGETDPELITGGWLCEIDNYLDKPQVYINDRTSGKTISTTIHSPDSLSSKQTTYIYNLVRKIGAAVYCRDKTSTEWEKLIDIDMLARYYLTKEILYEIEIFAGSCYWSKDRGNDTKVMFGPVWDFDQACRPWGAQNFCYLQQVGDNNPSRNHWIAEIAKFPRFQQCVREIWRAYNDSAAATLDTHAAAWVERVRAAHNRDVQRWQELAIYSDITARSQAFMNVLHAHSAWLDEQWSKPLPVIGDCNDDSVINSLDVATLAQHLLDRPASTLNTTNANTYDDAYLDISDLVGVVRQIYRIEHPDASLPYPTPPRTVSDDRDIDTRTTLGLGPAVPTGGATVRVPVFVNGSISYTALQFDVAVGSAQVVNVVADNSIHRVEWSQLADSAGTTRVLLWSDSLVNTRCSSQLPIIELELTGDSGSHDFDFTAIQLAQHDMLPHCLANVQQTRAWYNVRLGDANADGRIDIQDVNEVINIILDLDHSADPMAADLDGNRTIDIYDLNAILNIILQDSSSAPHGN